jgi:hypothetical protein
MFNAASRYANQPIAVWVDADGRARPFVVLREVPAPPAPSGADPIHVVTAHDRLDRIAWQQLGDAQLFWRLCDANGALHPDELTAVAGRRLAVPRYHAPPQP